MRAKFKPLAGQAIVVTGATSGLGSQAARLAAASGAAVVLAAGDEMSVRRLCEETAGAGGRVHAVVGDISTAEGCDRVARAAAARFGRIDSWIEASGDEAALAHAAAALVRRVGERVEPAALVAFGRRISQAARTELTAAHGKVAVTLVRLPKGWRPDSPAKAAAEAALHAVTKPMGKMALAARGEGLTAVTEVKKHPGLVAGAGLVALAGVALWLGRGRMTQAAQVAARGRPAKVATRTPKRSRFGLTRSKEAGDLALG